MRGGARAHRVGDVVAPGQDVLVAEAMIDLPHPLVVVDPGRLCVEQVQRLAGKVGLGPEDLPQFGRGAIHATRGHALVCKGIPGQRTVGGLARRQRVEKLGPRIAPDISREIAGEHFVCRNDVQQRRVAAAPLTFVHEEKECPVADDRASDRRSELVLPELGFLCLGAVGEESRRVEVVVSHELEDRSVNLVGAGLRHDVHVGPGGGAEFGGRDVGLDPELLNCVDRGLHAESLEERLVVVDSIQRVVVSFAPQSADRDRCPVGLESGHRAGARDSSRDQHGQLGEATSVERQLDDLLVVDGRRHRRTVGLELRQCRGDIDHLRHLPNAHR